MNRLGDLSQAQFLAFPGFSQFQADLFQAVFFYDDVFHDGDELGKVEAIAKSFTKLGK